MCAVVWGCTLKHESELQEESIGAVSDCPNGDCLLMETAGGGGDRERDR